MFRTENRERSVATDVIERVVGKSEPEAAQTPASISHVPEVSEWCPVCPLQCRATYFVVAIDAIISDLLEANPSVRS